MTRLLLFGNSGSGKSTMAQKLVAQHGLAHLDLDTLAWLPTQPPQRAPLQESARAIQDFMNANAHWVIEGCYTDLLEVGATAASEIVFLNLPLADCLANARQRPWEPHKYPSKAAQDANLDMLLDWIAQYQVRDDEFSYAAHHAFYSNYTGKKRMINQNQPL